MSEGGAGILNWSQSGSDGSREVTSGYASLSRVSLSIVDVSRFFPCAK